MISHSAYYAPDWTLSCQVGVISLAWWSDLFAGPQISSRVLIGNHAFPNLPYGKLGPVGCLTTLAFDIWSHHRAGPSISPTKTTCLATSHKLRIPNKGLARVERWPWVRLTRKPVQYWKRDSTNKLTEQYASPIENYIVHPSPGTVLSPSTHQ